MRISDWSSDVCSSDLLPVLIMGALAVALTVNYPRLADQRKRIETHADNVVMVVVLIFAAGAFTGIMGGTGMTDAMARALLAGVPESFGPYLAPIKIGRAHV